MQSEERICNKCLELWQLRTLWSVISSCGLPERHVQKWFQSATCLPFCHLECSTPPTTPHIQGTQVREGPWSFSFINSILNTPLITVCKSQMTSKMLLQHSVPLFIGLLEVVCGNETSSGDNHNMAELQWPKTPHCCTWRHSSSGYVNGFYLAAVCFLRLYCFLCQKYAFILFSQPGDIRFSHREASLNVSTFF